MSFFAHRHGPCRRKAQRRRAMIWSLRHEGLPITATWAGIERIALPAT
jgi:hypothetical protein